MDFLFDRAFDCIPPKVNRRAKPWLVKHQNWEVLFWLARTTPPNVAHLLGLFSRENGYPGCSFAHQNTKHSTVLHGDVVLGEWDGGGGI